MEKLFDLKMFKYLKLLLRPLIIAFIGSILWFFIHKKIEFSKEDEGVFELLLGMVGIAHSVIASFQIQKVANQQDLMYQALQIKNKELFLQMECLRIDPIIKFLLFIFSVIFFIVFLLFPFKEIYSGIIVVFITIFVLYLLWEVAVELDDPYHGLSKISKESIVKAFKEDISNGKAL